MSAETTTGNVTTGQEQEQGPPLSALVIANYFIERSREDVNIEMTPMKLIKMVYLAHGWHLGLFQAPLLTENIATGEFGPTVKSVFDSTKEYGNEQITGWIPKVAKPTFQPYLKLFLAQIWETYKDWSALQLSANTNAPGTPWEDAKTKYQAAFIPDKLIQDFYGALVQANQNKTISGA